MPMMAKNKAARLQPHLSDYGVAVVGGLSMDYVGQASHLPEPGGSVVAKHFRGCRAARGLTPPLPSVDLTVVLLCWAVSVQMPKGQRSFGICTRSRWMCALLSKLKQPPPERRSCRLTSGGRSKRCGGPAATTILRLKMCSRLLIYLLLPVFCSYSWKCPSSA